MRKILFNLTFIVLGLFFSNMTCNKEDTPPDGCIKVKMIGYLCGQANFQILDSKYFTFGEDGWVDGGGKKWDHAFKALLTCNDLQLLDAMARPTYEGLEFTLKILEKQEDTGCAICKALLHGPMTWHYVKFQDDSCK
jgi:hypothetical protein